MAILPPHKGWIRGMRKKRERERKGEQWGLQLQLHSSLSICFFPAEKRNGGDVAIEYQYEPIFILHSYYRCLKCTYYILINPTRIANIKMSEKTLVKQWWYCLSLISKPAKNFRRDTHSFPICLFLLSLDSQQIPEFPHPLLSPAQHSPGKDKANIYGPLKTGERTNKQEGSVV